MNEHELSPGNEAILDRIYLDHSFIDGGTE